MRAAPVAQPAHLLHAGAPVPSPLETSPSMTRRHRPSPARPRHHTQPVSSTASTDHTVDAEMYALAHHHTAARSPD
jgi:hypothetical protein